MREAYIPFGEREILWLSSRDTQLGAAISKMENPKQKLLRDIFSGLVFFILQQISAKAAETEWIQFQRFFAPVVPENICRFTPEEIVNCNINCNFNLNGRRCWRLECIVLRYGQGKSGRVVCSAWYSI